MTIPFAPVPSRTNRRDGWTPERQRDFIEALALIGLVSAAAAHVGKSRKSAYALHGRPGEESFAAAWDEAADCGGLHATHSAFHRAIHGVALPIFYKGLQVGERRVYDDRLLAAALRHVDPQKYAPASLSDSNDDA